MASSPAFYCRSQCPHGPRIGTPSIWRNAMGENNRHQLLQCFLRTINLMEHSLSAVIVGKQQRNHRVSKNWRGKYPVLTHQNYSPEDERVCSRKREANISSVLMFCKHKSSDYWGHIFEKKKTKHL